MVRPGDRRNLASGGAAGFRGYPTFVQRRTRSAPSWPHSCRIHRSRLLQLAAAAGAYRAAGAEAMRYAGVQGGTIFGGGCPHALLPVALSMRRRRWSLPLALPLRPCPKERRFPGGGTGLATAPSDLTDRGASYEPKDSIRERDRAVTTRQGVAARTYSVDNVV
jgi:hypothetical protein